MAGTTRTGAGDSTRRAFRIKALSRGLETVYIYFNNDVEGYAVQNARALLHFLKELPED